MTTSYFNPRTREGCDKAVDDAINAIITDFNPRTREGCDLRLRLGVAVFG